jgi:2-polyprenyl-3-methyl-5-hydroxy-6-metoxy-1,4-benzoquinol methylase
MTSSTIGNALLPSAGELEELFFQKHSDTAGWAPRRRLRFRYFPPGDVYEGAVRKQVVPGCSWLDVGGGHAIFPENSGLARALAQRCAKVVAVDPSENIHQNAFVHERVQCKLEDYEPGFQFDLATLRMVVEHVDSPQAFTDALARLIRPGGTAIVFTVNRWTPVTILSGLIPFQLHHPIKRGLWRSEERDTFPVRYRMNTRKELRGFFEKSGFQEQAFSQLDDLSTFSRFNLLNYLDLHLWRGLRSLGWHYPDNCLLGIYSRRER